VCVCVCVFRAGAPSSQHTFQKSRFAGPAVALLLKIFVPTNLHKKKKKKVLRAGDAVLR
jgi:hypothetical protein